MITLDDHRGNGFSIAELVRVDGTDVVSLSLYSADGFEGASIEVEYNELLAALEAV